MGEFPAKAEQGPAWSLRGYSAVRITQGWGVLEGERNKEEAEERVSAENLLTGDGGPDPW